MYQKETADFFTITAWERVGENCAKYLLKGARVAVIGRLQSNVYEKNGEKHYSTEIIAEQIEFLEKSSRHKSENTVDINVEEDLETLDDLGGELPY